MSRIFSTAILASVLSQVFAAPMGGSYGSSYGSGSYGAQKVDASAQYSTMMDDSMSSTMTEAAMATGTMMMDDMMTTSTTMAAAATSTWASSSYSSSYGSNVIYGSSSNTWGGSGYSSCVQQCVATYGMGSSSSWSSGSSSSSDSSSYGDMASSTSTAASAGNTVTVTVAPMKGILRYVPPVFNVSVGDTINWVWGAGPHSVTQGSELTPCNRSDLAGAFDSGLQNATQTFQQVVNSTDTIFFYCSVPGHCEKGMFGIANPPNTNPGAVGTLPVSNTTADAATSTNSSLSLGSWVMSQAASNPSMAAMYNYVSNMTMGTNVYGWGMDTEISGMPSSTYGDLAESVMYASMVYVMNPGLLEKGQGMTGSNITFPADITNLAVTSASTSAASVPTTMSGAAYGSYGSATTTTGGASATGGAAGGSLSSASSGSGRLAASSTMMGLVVAVVASLVL
ncbi:hypothetical protein FRB96_009463 [Tulasnella sp. 330]|nr:hypothetical protein FRB96_009463 [Tulasnella sp. 330]KAG8874643.1 hypothetical protein FRB97_005762 [Tulasnella sp. 331]KAG8879544.1 hypothetical protein FRB98_005658 [Tulasnella sp. 332]